MVEAAERYEQLPLGQVLESAHNVRKTFDRHRMQDLVESIGAKGIITPLIVRRAGEDQYEIAAGHRRFRAAQEVGLATVPAIIREYDDDTFLEVLTVENLQREDIHPLEEARRCAGQEGALEACRQEGIALPLRVMGSMLVQTLVQDAYTNLPRPVQMRICAARGLPEPTWDNDPMIATFPAMLPSDLWQVMAECVIFGELPAAGHSDNDALEEPKRLVDVIGAAPDEEWLEKRSAEIRAKYEEQIAALREKEATPAAEPKKGKGKKAS